MAFQLDAKFFRRAKKVNRAVEITDSHAIIPAVKDSPEIRVALPNRRAKTFEERTAEMDLRFNEIEQLEEQIESERKVLLDNVRAYRESGSGVANVVVQNLKIKDLMIKRSRLARPEQWIEELPGLTLKDIFESKRDISKIGSDVYQMKRRVEPITSLYVDLGAAADAAQLAAEEKDAARAASTVAAGLAKTAATTAKRIAATLLPQAPTAEESARTGAVIGVKKVLKLKKTLPPV
jgi:hypothetical protein